MPNLSRAVVTMRDEGLQYFAYRVVVWAIELISPALPPLGVVSTYGSAKHPGELMRKYVGDLPDEEDPGRLRVLHYEILIEYIEEIEVDREADIADISTGQGYLLKELSRNGYENLTGVDIDPPSDGVLDGVQYEFVQTDINQDGLASIDSDSFDLVVSSETIEHLHNPHEFVLDLARITRDGGIILLTTPNIESIQERLRFFFTGEFSLFPVASDEKVRTGEAHMAILHENVLRNSLQVTDFDVFEEFGDFAVFTSVAFGGRRTGHLVSYSKGYDIRTSSDG